MTDFTLKAIHRLDNAFLESGYRIQMVCDFIKNPAQEAVVFRHDIDRAPGNALKMAVLENRIGISGTYYFRCRRGAFPESEIKEIHRLGHEIGYHYEDFSRCRGDIDQALEEFEANLNTLRRIVPVSTICMHGSPLSRFDNRDLWKETDYREYGIAAEPYFDIDFSEVLYLTDTGRRWDGGDVSIRDRVKTEIGNRNRERGKYLKLHSTRDMIRAVESNALPDRIMLNIHPQRWSSNPVSWTGELVMQNVKNIFKRILVKMNEK